MGQVHVQVILTNYREEVLARLGQFSADQVHRYETEALIDTGTYRSVLPPAVAERLGLLRLRGVLRRKWPMDKRKKLISRKSLRLKSWDAGCMKTP